MITRDDVPFYVSVLMGDRPVRWAPPELRRGDYDGRECTLEVFLADAREQLGLLEAIGEDDWAKIEAAAGGPVVYIFHTTKESQERYAAFLLGFLDTLGVAGTVVVSLDGAYPPIRSELGDDVFWWAVFAVAALVGVRVVRWVLR